VKGTTQVQRQSGTQAGLNSISGVPFTYLVVDPATRLRATPASQKGLFPSLSRDHIRPVGFCRSLEHPSARCEVDVIGIESMSRAGTKPGLQMRSSRQLETRPILEAPVVDDSIAGVYAISSLPGRCRGL
jgi:hypothetical protein